MEILLQDKLRVLKTSVDILILLYWLDEKYT